MSPSSLKSAAPAQSAVPKRPKNVPMGGYAVTTEPGQTIATILGSCVSACIRDPVLNIGGLNHFMLPSNDTGDWAGAELPLRYGNHAMEVLINDLLRMGCARPSLEVKLFGGASVINSSQNIGGSNAEFAMTYIKNENLKLVSHDLGGDCARKIIFDPATGVVKRKLLEDRGASNTLSKDEDAFRQSIRSTPKPQDDDIELFD